MSDSTASGKIQEISEHLKANIIEPAEREAEKIIEEAQRKKDEIIAAAEKEAQAITLSLEKKAKQKLDSVEAALRLSGRQAITALKKAMEDDILNKTLGQPLSVVLEEEEVLKVIISEMVKAYVENDFSGEIEILLSEKNRNKLNNYIKSESAKAIKEGIKLSLESVGSGCKVIFKENHAVFDFSAEAVTELLAGFLRNDLRSYIFEE